MIEKIKSEVKNFLLWSLSTFILIYTISIYLDILVEKPFVLSNIEFFNLFFGYDVFYLIYIIIIAPYILNKLITLISRKTNPKRSNIFRFIIFAFAILVSAPFIYSSFEDYLTEALVAKPLEFNVTSTLFRPTKDDFKSESYLRTWAHWCGTGNGITYEYVEFENDSTFTIDRDFIVFDDWFAIKHLLRIGDYAFMKGTFLYKNDSIKKFTWYVENDTTLYQDKLCKYQNGKLLTNQTDELIIDE